ncbi:hypothetical protein HDR66_03025 [bacterium]|nr:hypothetical protein [bacterium]
MDSNTIKALSESIESLDDAYKKACRIPDIDAMVLNDLQTAQKKLKSALRMALVSKNVIPHVKICTVLLQAGMWPLMLRKHPSEIAQITTLGAAGTWVATMITDIILLKSINKKMSKAIESAARCNEYATKLLKANNTKQK